MSKLIPLTRGKFAIVDGEDYECMIRLKWHVTTNGYARGQLDGHFVLMPRLILNAQVGEECGHIDGNRLNNVRSNLRIVTRSQNQGNRFKQKSPTSSQYKGVYWHVERKKWYAMIYQDGINYYLGRFVDEIDAARAYDSAAIMRFGEYARLNFPEVT